MPNSFEEYLYILPFIIVGLGILISVTIEMYSKKSVIILPWLSVVIFLSAGYYSLYTVNEQAVMFNNMIAVGGIANIFIFMFNFGAAIVCLLSADYLKKYGTNFGEFYLLIQNSVLGMMLMAAAKDLLTVFMGLELMSICFYVLAGLNRKNSKSTEAGLKYFLLGAFATGFLVYGIALIYGTVHTTSLDAIYAGFATYNNNLLFITGLLLFLVGFSFKIAAFPFHMWVPDVYQGSSTVTAALMSTGGKAAAFSAILMVMAGIFTSTGNIYAPYLAVISLLSMVYGSIVAIAQSDIKRMLAYSSIAHAGYMVIGLASGNVEGVAGIVYYLLAYTFMNLAAFGIISVVEGENDTKLNIDDFAGLGNRNPLLAAFLAMTMFALAGIPPFAGFFGKYYVFISAIKGDLTWLAIAGALSSVISVYFYLRIVVVMYFKNSNEITDIEVTSSSLLGILVSVLLFILLGILPGTVINIITSFLN